MKFNPKTTFVAALLTIVASCGGGGAEALADDMQDSMEGFVETLEGIESKEDLTDAQSEFDEIFAEMKSLAAKAKELPEEEREGFDPSEDEDMKELQKKFVSETARISKIEDCAEPMQALILKMGEAMQ